METWLPVVGWEGDYEVSSIGRVRSVHKLIQKPNGGSYTRVSKILRPARTADGYLRCAFSKVGSPGVRRYLKGGGFKSNAVI